MSIAEQLEVYLARITSDPDDQDALAAIAEMMRVKDAATFVLEGMYNTFAKKRNWAGLLECYSNLSRLVTEPTINAKILLATGRLLEMDPSRHQEAIQIYNEAFLTNPLDSEPLRAARNLYHQYEQWEAVHQMLNQEIQIERDSRILAQLWTELGQLKWQQFGDQQGAQAAFRSALDQIADWPDAVKGLAMVTPKAVAAETVPAPGAEIQAPPAGRARRAHEPAAREKRAKGAEPKGPPPVEPEPPTPAIPLSEEGPPALPAETGAPIEPAAQVEELGLEEVEVIETAGGKEVEEPTAPSPAIKEARPRRRVKEALQPVPEQPPRPETPPEVAPPDAEKEPARTPWEGEKSTQPEIPALRSRVLAGEPGGEVPPGQEGEPPSAPEAQPGTPAPPQSDEPTGAEPGKPARKPAPAAKAPAAHRETVEPGDAVTAELPAVTRESTYEYWFELAGTSEGEKAAEAYLKAIAVLRPPRERGQVKETFARALAADPDVGRWLSEIRPGILSDREAWEGILECLLEKAGEGADGAVTRAIYEVAFYHLQDYERAVSLAGQQVADNEEQVKLAATGNWRRVELQLAADLTKAGVLNPEQQASVQCAMIALGLNKVDKAIDALRSIMRTQELDRPYRELLKALYRSQEKWQPLLDVLKKEVDLATTDDAKIGLMREMVVIYRDYLNRSDMVVKTYQSILAIDPRDRESLEQLSAKLEEMRNYPALVDVLRRRAEIEESLEARTRTLLQVADVYVNKFSNQAEAVRAYEAVLEVAPENLEAIEYLSRMYRQRGDWKRLVEIQRSYVDQLEDPSQRVEVLSEIANVAFDRLRNLELAEELWQEVLLIQPEDERALDALSKVYERQKNWSELATVLERCLSFVKGEEQKKLLDKLGGILADRLHDRERAVKAYEALIELEPDNRRAQDALRKTYIDLSWWDRLEEFYARQGAWAEYLRTLETLAGQQQEPEVSIDLLFRSTRIWLEQLNDVTRAVRALERIRLVDPNNRQAASQLAGFYEAAGNFRKLREVLQVLLEGETEPETRFDLLVRLARLNQSLRDMAVSFELYCEAVGTLPQRTEILDEVEALARDVDRWRDLEETYSRAMAQTRAAGDFENTEILSLRLGRVLDEELGRADQALECFQEVLTNNPSSLRAIEALITIHQRQGDNEALLDMYQRRFEIATEADEQVTILSAMAEVYESGLVDVTSALEKHLEILTLVSPQHAAFRSSLKALHRLYRQEENWTALAEIIEREIGIADPQEEMPLLSLYGDLGQVCLHQLGDIRRALTAYSQVLRRDPSNATARADLESLLDDPANALESCAVLEPIYEHEQNWPALVRVLEIRFQHMPETTETLSQRKELLGRIVQIQAQQRHDLRSAFEAATRMLALAPQDNTIREQLEEFAAAIPAWSDLAEVLSDRLMQLVEQRGDEPMRQLAASYAFRLAQICDTCLDQADRAIDHYRQTLELAPQHRPALDALADLYTRNALWSELLEVHQRQIELSQDPAEIRSLRFKIAALHEDLLNNPLEAIATYLRILADDPEDGQALGALNRLYEAEGQWPELAGNLDRQIALCEPGSSQWCAGMCRLADIEERQLNDTTHAVSIYREVLEKRPDDEQAMASLERLMAEPTVASEASRILSPLYEASGDTPKLIAALKTELEYTDEPSQRLALYHRIAQLYETGLERPGEAFAILLLAVGEAPLETSTLDSLYRFAQQEDLWPQLATRLDELAASLDDSIQASSLYVRLASMAEDQLGDPQRAAGYWRAVLDRNPGDRDAVLALERLYRFSLLDWEQLVDVLLMKVELPEVIAEPKLRKEVFIQAATLYEDMLLQKDRAIEMLERVIEVDDRDEHALRELDRLYQQTERWTELIENCNRRLALADQDADRQEIWYQMGPIYETQLSDPEQAIQVYHQILDLSDQEAPALEALERLYNQTENWVQLLDNLERQRALAQSDTEKRELRYRVGRLSQTRLFDLGQAIDIYAEILSGDPGSAQAIDALEEMLQQGDEMARVAEVLGPLYASAQQWRKLISMFELLVKDETDPALRADYYRRIADIYEHQLNDPQGTFDALCIALKEIPSQEAFATRLEQLASTLGRWSELVPILESLRDEVAQPEVRISLGKRCGRILEKELGEITSAIEAYNNVLEIHPEDLETLQAIAQLYQEAGQWPDLAGVIEKLIYLSQTEQASLPLRYRLGTLYETLLDDPTRAVEVFNDILAIDPGNFEAVGSLERMFEAGRQPDEIAPILEPIYRQKQDWPRLVDLKLKMVAYQESPDQRFDTLCQAGEIAIQQMSDKSAALVIYGNALCERPGDESTLARVEELAGELGAYSDLADIFQAALGRDLSDFDAQRLSLKLARTLNEQLADTQGALAWYRKALDLEPTSTEALRALDALYTHLELWPDLAVVLRSEREQAMVDTELVALSFRLAQVYELHLTDLDAAVAAYNDVLDVDPTHNQSLSALENIYKRRGDWEALYTVYQRQSNLAETDEQRAIIFRSMAELAMSGLDRLDEAIDLWLQVRNIYPEDQEALTSLEFLYEQTERHDELVEVLEKRAELTQEPQEQIAIFEKIGQVWRMLGNDSRAISAYQALLELAPGHREALLALRELYEAAGSSEPLCGILAQIISRGYLDQEGLIEAYQRLGEIYGDVLGKYSEAIQAWGFVLQLRPGDEQALDQLERFYLEGEHWKEAITILEQKLLKTEDPGDQIEYLLRIAELWQHRVGDLEQASAVYERLLQLNPGSEAAVTALEDIYQQQSNWDPLADLFLRRYEFLSDPFERLEVLRKSALVYEEKKQQPESAFLVMLRAFQEDPLDLETANKLEQLAEITGQWDNVVAMYTQIISQVAVDHGEQATLELHQRLAAYYHEKLDRAEMAQVHYLKVLEIEPSNEKALGALEDLYQRAGAWQELIAVLKRRLDLPIDDTQQIELYLKIGGIQKDRTFNIDEAIHSFKMVLRLDEQNHDSLLALENIHERREEWRELIDVLEKRASATYEPELVIDLKFRIGQLWQIKLGVPERAVDVYRDILLMDPTYVPAMDTLEKLYVELEKWDRYIDLLDMRLSLDLPLEKRAEFLITKARVHRAEFSENEQAVDCYRQVLELQPGRIDVVQELQAIYLEQEYWEELAAMLTEQVEHVADPATRIQLLSTEGRLAKERLDDTMRAIDRFQKVLAIDPDNLQALRSLATLYGEVGQWEEAIGVFNRLIMKSEDLQTRTGLLCQVAEIYEKNILDDAAALERLQTALDLDMGCMPALRGLQRLHEKQEDWDSAIQIIQRQVDYSRDLVEKSALLSSIGSICEERLDDRPTAMDYYQRAIDLNPQNAVAAAPLAEYFLNEKEWARAIPLLESLIESEAYRTAAEGLHLLHYNAGLAAEELAQDEKAVMHFRAANEIDRTYLPAMEGLARMYTKREDTDRAFEVYANLLIQYGRELDDAKIAEIYTRQGDIKLKVGERRAALDLFEKALSLNPRDRTALEKLIEVVTKQEDWERAVDYQMQLSELAETDEERFKLLVDTGDVYRDKLGRMEDAINVYKDAFKVDPNSKVVLHRLLDIFTKAENWKRASEILGKLAELETDPERQSKIFYTMASILKEHLDDQERSISFFNKALDVNVRSLQAFQTIDTILTQAKDWKKLEHNYQKMIKRIIDYADEDLQSVKAMLWRNLGEIYRTRLHDWDNAIEAFKAAAKLTPQDPTVHEILADLYERVEGHAPDAIEEHHALIQADPFRFQSYQALFNRYLEMRNFDAAWCVAGALTLLDKAADQEREYYQKYLSAKLPYARRQLTPEQWQLLYHPEQDIALGNILAMFANFLRDLFSYDLKSTWKVHKKKDLLDLSEQILFSQLFNYGVRILGVSPCNVYVKKDQVGGLRNANSDPPALVAGSDMLTGRDERELAFYIGKALCLMRPEHYLGSAFPVTENLKLFFFAAWSVTQPKATLPLVRTPDFDNLVREVLNKPHSLVAIQKVTQYYLDSGINPNFSTWLKAVDYTSDRAGLLLCSDLKRAVQAVKAEQISVSKAVAKERIKELVVFSVSQPYLKLRKELGLAIGTE